MAFILCYILVSLPNIDIFYSISVKFHIFIITILFTIVHWHKVILYVVIKLYYILLVAFFYSTVGFIKKGNAILDLDFGN